MGGARERSDVLDMANEVMKIKLKSATARLTSTRAGDYAVKNSMKPRSSCVGGPGRGGGGDPDDSDDDGDHDHESNGRRGRDRDDDDDSGRRRDRGNTRKRKANRDGSEEGSLKRSESSSREPRGMIAVPKMPALDPKNYWWNGNTAFLQYYIEKWRRLLDPRNYSAAQAVNFMLQCVPEDKKYIINDCNSLEAMVKKLVPHASDERTYLLKIIHKLKSHNKSQNYHEDKRLLEFCDKVLANITKLNSAYTLDYFTAQIMINKLSSDSMRSKYLDQLKDLMVETKDAHGVDNYLVTMQQIIVKAKIEIDMIVDVNQGDLSESVRQAAVYSTQVYGRGNDFRGRYNNYRGNRGNYYNKRGGHQSNKEHGDPINLDEKGNLLWDSQGNPLDASIDDEAFALNSSSLEIEKEKAAPRGGRGSGQGRGSSRGLNRESNRGSDREAKRGSDRGRGSNRGSGKGQTRGHGSKGGRGTQSNPKGQHKGRKCTVCKEKGHNSLLYCPKLPEYVPRGFGAKLIPKEVCKYCLSTAGHYSTCLHTFPKDYADWICNHSKTNFVLCRDCEKHQAPQDWLKENFNPKFGLGNLYNLWKEFKNDTAIINSVQIEATDQITENTNNQEISDHEQTAYVQAVLINNLRIGRACSPFEVIKVQTKSGCYPIVLIYDTGAQAH